MASGNTHKSLRQYEYYKFVNNIKIQKYLYNNLFCVTRITLHAGREPLCKLHVRQLYYHKPFFSNHFYEKQ